MKGVYMSVNKFELSEEVVRGLKAKLVYECCDLKCTPADRCECDRVLHEMELANQWILSLPGNESDCDSDVR